MSFIAVILIVGVALYFGLSKRRKSKLAPDEVEFPATWRLILDQKVLFYHNLPPDEKKRFERDVSRFLKKVKITGVETSVDITDKLLVASSAAIPVFGFPDWDYTFLDEVLLYPSSFDSDFSLKNRDEVITGMVGSGTMNGKMILSKPSLHLGFSNESDKKNVGVHEFIHLLDKEDGAIDGIPATLLNRKHSMPWLKLIREKMIAINSGDSDINTYGATSEVEFLAVAGEYFFERPQLLQQKHPELYEMLEKAFNQDTASILVKSKLPKSNIERNDPCPCGSGLKFKKCCLAKKVA